MVQVTRKYRISYTFITSTGKRSKQSTTAFGETSEIAVRTWKRGLVNPRQFVNIRTKRLSRGF